MALQSFTVSIGALRDVNNNDKNYVSGEAIYVKTIGGTFAPIFRDLAGTSEIAQDGLANQTNEKGQFTFFVEAGDYILEYQNQSTPVTVVGADYFNNRVEETVNQIIIDTATSRGFRVVGDFSSGFTYELPNDVAIDGSGNYWAYADVNALPVTVTAGTTPTEGEYSQRTWNEASAVVTTAGINAQQFIDNFDLKIFQSPTDNLTKVSTFAGGVGVVYEVSKASDNILATIYSDAAGTTEIVQNGTNNVSDSVGVVEFYIADGDYYVEVGNSSARTSVYKKTTRNMSTSELSESSLTVGDKVSIVDRGGIVFYIDAGSPDGFGNLDAGSGLVAKITFNDYPSLVGLGVSQSKSDTGNAVVLQHAADEYGGAIGDINFSFDQQLLLPESGFNFTSVKPITITWTGSSLVYAMTPANSNGSYDNYFENITLTGASDKLLFDARRVRFSEFKNFNCLGGAVCLRISSSWNTNWTDCAFRNQSKTPGSKALFMEYDDLEPFNVVNTAIFDGCYFAMSDMGVVIETGGDGIHFRNSRIEGNNQGVVFQGKGGSHGIIFNDGCYIEGNSKGNIIWNKTGAGNFYGVVFENNYFGTEVTSRAGIVEFIASNGGGHSLTFRNNTMRDFGGLPTQNVLLDVNGASMSSIQIEWFRNGKGVNVPAFNKNAVDWRYMHTDVLVKLNYLSNPVTNNNFQPAYTNGDIYVGTVGFGIARVFGTFTEPTNVSNTPLNVTEAMPVSLRPPAFGAVRGVSLTDANTEADDVTVMINGGQIRSINITDKKISFDKTYNLNVSKLFVS
jgi:hypothetical protein